MTKKITDHYVGPHQKISREVEDKDLPRLKSDALIMKKLCFAPVGVHTGGYAVAHQQINKKDPLRFFVTRDGNCVINPVIVNHTRHTIDSEEGCLSFPDKGTTIVPRWNKCEVEYSIIDDEGKISERMTDNISSHIAKIFQHEIDHMDCKYIY